MIGRHAMRRTIPAALAVALALTGTLDSSAFARRSYASRDCNPETGDAIQPSIQALNRLKNRSTAPTPFDIDKAATLRAMTAPGDDINRWNPNRGATVVGYVASVKPGGVETVNCHARSLHGRDTHIDLTVSPRDAADETRHVIVEVTPHWRTAMAAKGVNWETDALEQTISGRCVAVTGWMLFDAEHRNESANTAKPGREVWRATAWEVHPITGIRVLPSCRPGNAK